MGVSTQGAEGRLQHLARHASSSSTRVDVDHRYLCDGVGRELLCEHGRGYWLPERSDMDSQTLGARRARERRAAGTGRLAATATRGWPTLFLGLDDANGKQRVVAFINSTYTRRAYCVAVATDSRR